MKSGTPGRSVRSLQYNATWVPDAPLFAMRANLGSEGEYHSFTKIRKHRIWVHTCHPNKLLTNVSQKK